MVMGKLGAFLNKDMGAIVKDAGKVLNADLGTLAKGAGRVLKTDLGELLRDKPETGETVAAPIAKQVSPVATTPAPTFDPDVTQKLERPPAAPVVAAAFDPDITQKMDFSLVAVSASPTTIPKAGESTSPDSTGAFTFNEELLRRVARDMPGGTGVKVLLPYSVGGFDRPHSTPSGELTNDPVNALYACRGETLMVQLALCWDSDEAAQLVAAVIAKVGAAPRAAPDRTWVIGPTPQGLVYAWTRDCYFFCATSPKGAATLERFLSAFPF